MAETVHMLKCAHLGNTLHTLFECVYQCIFHFNQINLKWLLLFQLCCSSWSWRYQVPCELTLLTDGLFHLPRFQSLKLRYKNMKSCHGEMTQNTEVSSYTIDAGKQSCRVQGRSHRMTSICVKIRPQWSPLSGPKQWFSSVLWEAGNCIYTQCVWFR